MVNESPVSIVILQPHLRFGGAENQTVLIANRLVQRGHKCTIVLHSRTGGLLELLDERIIVVDLGFNAHAGIVAGSIRALHQLRQMPPSLLLVRLWSSILLVGLVHRHLSRHRIIYYEDLDPRGHSDFIRFGALKKFVVGLVFRAHPKSLIANTNHVADAMIAEYGLKSKPSVIPCAVDVPRIRALAKKPVNLPVKTVGAIRLVTVGSLTDLKGIRELYDMLSAQATNIQWVVVGDGPLREFLEAAPTGPSELEVVIVGSTSNPYPYMAESDALIHGAKSESFGLVVLEALVLGKPVLANYANGPLEIKSTTESPLMRFFSLGDAGALSALLNEITAFGPNQSIGRSVYPIESSQYDLDKCVDSWVAECRLATV